MEQSSAQDEDEEDTEAMSALIATLAVVFIGGLALSAGQFGGAMSFPNSFGLVLCACVIGVFAIVVFLDTISQWPVVRFAARIFRGLAKFMRPLAGFYNYVDAGLVRIGAGIVGMGHRSVWSRYGILAGLLTCLALLGWWLPAPLGLLPVFLAFVLSVSVSRLWSWVEDDRALAAMTDYSENAPYRVGFREDFRDETLLGFIFVFVLIPIAMMQAHVGEVFGPDLFKNADEKGFLSWFGYFGIELAKAVPIVDWAEIYNVTPGKDLIQMQTTASRHSVFLARVLVDLVLIAGLLQAIAIATRNRHQKRLFQEQHIDRLDAFVERVEMARAIRATRRVESGSIGRHLSTSDVAKDFNLQALRQTSLTDFRRYNRKRLRDLYWSDDSASVRAFIEALSRAAGFSLSTAIDQTLELAEGPHNELDLIRAFDRAVAEHDEGGHLMEANDLYRLLIALRTTSGLKDFKFRVMDKLVEIGPADEAIDHLASVAAGKSADQYQYARNRAAELIAELSDSVAAITVIEQVGIHLSQRVELPQKPKAHVLRATLAKLRARLKVIKAELKSSSTKNDDN